MLKLLLVSIVLMFIVNCSTSINSIKEQYYSIDIINGIDKEEATTTALYNALLDDVFNTSSTEEISSTVVNKDENWLVSLTHTPSNKSANYLINKRSGNTKSQAQQTDTAPVKFFSSFDPDPQRAKIEINPVQHNTLSKPSRFEKNDTFQANIDEEHIQNFATPSDTLDKTVESESESVIAFYTPDFPESSIDNPDTISDEDPGKSFELPARTQEFGEEPILTFDYLESLESANRKSGDIKDDEPDRPIDDPNEVTETEITSVIAFPEIEEPAEKHAEESPNKRFNSNEKEKSRDSSNPSNINIKTRKTVTSPKRINIDTEELMSLLSGESITSNKNIKKSTPKSTTKPARKPTKKTIPKTTKRQKKTPLKRPIKKQRKNNGPTFTDAFPREDEKQEPQTAEIVSELEPELELEPRPVPEEIATQQDTSQDTVQDNSSEITQERVLKKEKRIAFSEDEPTDEEILLDGGLMQNEITESALDKTKRMQRGSEQNFEPQTPSTSDSPAYDLKLLSGGFETDLNNRITLKSDHNMNFSDDTSSSSEDFISTEDFINDNDISNEIANEAIQRIVEAPQTKDQFETTQEIQIEDISAQKERQRQKTEREWERESERERNRKRRRQIEKEIAKLTAERDRQLARLSEKKSISTDIISKGDTVTIRGAIRGNRGIIRLMKETEIDGLRTRVTAYKLNGVQIAQLTKNLELTPGIHILTSRCYSSEEDAFDDAFDETDNVFENKIKVEITNAHEYLLEAQTYKFNGKIECAASVYDLRDAR